MLNVVNLNVAYGEVQVIWDVSFNINEKEIVSIVGPNGAGKSTIINTITGVVPALSGKILFNEDDIRSEKAATRVNQGIVQVPEGRLLFPNMTVKDNLKIGAFPKSARKDLDENLEFVFDLFPVVKERQNQVAGSLSGGEQQMLAIAMGLMAGPKLLILDEPSIGLAPIIVDRVLETLSKIRDTGITMMLVEQDVYVSLDIADRGYVIENGKVVMEGEAKKLLTDSHIKDAYLSI